MILELIEVALRPGTTVQKFVLPGLQTKLKAHP